MRLKPGASRPIGGRLPRLHTDSKTGAPAWTSLSDTGLICSWRTLSGAVSPLRPSPRPSLRFPPAEQVASLRSPAGCPNQRSGTGSSLLRTPPTSALARTAFPVSGVAPPVESSLLAMTDLPTYPVVTSRHVAHADHAGPLPLWFICIATCPFDSMPAPHPASRQHSWHGLRC